MDSFEHYRRFVNLTLLVKRNPFQSIKEFYGWSHPLCIKDDSSSAFLQFFQFYRSCLNSRIHLFDFININMDSILINSNLLQRSKISVL